MSAKVQIEEVKASVELNQSIPVLLITGFLGSGKTTFLNNLLNHSGWYNTIFIVNEFGSIGIDQHLLPEQSGIHLLPNGCICCVDGSSLAETLRHAFATARTSGRKVERVIIETSGISLPNLIIEALENDAFFSQYFSLGAVLTIADASQYFDQILRYPEIVDQVAAADLVYMSKTDLPSSSKSELTYSISEINPFCLVLDGDHLDRNTFVKIEEIISLGRPLPSKTTRPQATERRPLFHSRDINTFNIKVPYNVSLENFSLFTDAVTYLLGNKILRAKGFIKLREYDHWASINIVKKTLYPPLLTNIPFLQDDGCIVFITESIQREMIAEFLNVALGCSHSVQET